jgi:hypothetical protein
LRPSDTAGSGAPPMRIAPAGAMIRALEYALRTAHYGAPRRDPRMNTNSSLLWTMSHQRHADLVRQGRDERAARLVAAIRRLRAAR